MNRVPVWVFAQYKGLRMESSFFLLHPFLRKCGIRDSSDVFELPVSFLQTIVHPGRMVDAQSRFVAVQSD